MSSIRSMDYSSYLNKDTTRRDSVQRKYNRFDSIPFGDPVYDPDELTASYLKKDSSKKKMLLTRLKGG